MAEADTTVEPGAQRGRGAAHQHSAIDARAPHHLTPRGWQLVLGRVARRALGGQLPLYSAGIAFFAILSLAPVLLTAVSVYGAVNTPEQALAQLRGIAGMLPTQLEPLVAEQLTTVTANSTQVLTVRGITGLVVALWTATTAATYLVDALTQAYCEQETRGLLRRLLLGLAFVLGGALLLGGAIAGAGVFSRAVAGAPDGLRVLAEVLVWLALAVLMVVVLAVLYRFAPDRKQAQWRWVSYGAALAAALWVGTSLALFAYVQSLGTYEATYGSLAGVAISMFWLWISIHVVIVGAVLNAEAERQTTRDSTIGRERPLGERGAVVADSVPATRG